MAAVAELAPSVGTTRALSALGASRATWYRRGKMSSGAGREERERPPRSSPRALAPAEEQAILEVLHEERFVDRSPGHVVAALLDEGRYLASERTYYRILTRLGEARERRDQRRHPPRAVPRLVATEPNQVWTWDVSRIRGARRGQWFFLYVLLDLFSRYVVGFTLSRKLSGAVAAYLLEETVSRRAPLPDGLTVHNDRGAEFVAHQVGHLLEALEVGQSFSRPRTSNDNAHSESCFKTTKYHPDYPGSFPGLEPAWSYFEKFFGWYNDEHRHSGIARLTPADVYYGRGELVLASRQAVLDEAYARAPERFVNGPPQAPALPGEVWINRPATADREALGASLNSEKKMSQSH